MNHEDDYAGEHMLPDASFSVFKETEGWYWKSGLGLSFEGARGPVKTAQDAYDAAIETYEAKYGRGSD
jgi:hypothetical protein